MRNGTTAREPRTPLQSLVHHWLIALVLVSVGAAAGLAVGLRLPVTYTAEKRLAVGPGAMATAAATGFPQAARALAQDYARWVQNSAADDSLGLNDVVSVNASQIPDSSVLRIEATATSPEAAKSAVEAAAQKLIEAVALARKDNDPEKAYAEYNRLAPIAAEAELKMKAAETAFNVANWAKSSQSTLDQLSKAYVEAKMAYNRAALDLNAAQAVYTRLRADATTATQLRAITDTTQTATNRTATLQRLGLAGGGLGLLLALTWATLVDRRASRRAAIRSERES